MRVLLPAIVVMLAVPAFAGCLGETELPTETGVPVKTLNETIEAPPDNRTGEFAAFKETNNTEEGMGGSAHDHDYWGGKSRLSLFKARAEMEPSPDDENRAYAIFRLPPPSLVFEGTGKVEFKVSNPRRQVCEPAFTLNGEFICTAESPMPDPNPPPLTLEFLHAASDPDAWEDGGAVKWGDTTIIDVKDPKWTDMPHSTASLWAFKIVSANPQDVSLVFDISADLVHSEGEVPRWPGHPDFYKDTAHRLIYDGPGEVSDAGLTGETGLESKAIPAKLISYGTKTLHIWANVTSFSGTPEPTHWYLYFHNASYANWNSTDPFDANFTSDKKTLYWTIPVDENAMDTPYASLSRWEFMVRGSYTTPRPTGQEPSFACVSGCASYNVKYNLVIMATNIPLDQYSATRQA